MEKISSKIIRKKNTKDFLFEVSWEICNKFGGIYTVISSKLNAIKKYYSNYYAIGPYKNSNPEFLEFETIPKEFEKAFLELKNLGIILHFGEWKINKNTKTILIEYLGYSKNINLVKSRIWELYKIDSLNTSWFDWEEPILWSWCIGIAIEKLSKNINLDSNILVHVHEWLSGGTILYLKSLENKIRFNTIFTTHATMLGRALCGNSYDLYELEKKTDLNPEDEAYGVGVATKHQTERVLANISDCFTTVSDLTGKETEIFYKKKPDKILYNGFDNSNLQDIEKINLDFEKSREETNRFLESYFNNFYNLNLNNTQILYTSGRYEFKNKGLDLFIDSLSKLNKDLIKEDSKKEIIVFFLIMIGEYNISSQISDSIKNYNNGIKNNNLGIIYAPVSTHEVPTDNLIINEFIKKDLLNKKEDKVKVILIPTILDGKKNVFNKEYYQMIRGLDLGVFPSYYEPWGYTPLETLSYATPTITSDLAGFGRYCNNLNSKFNFIDILKREGRNFEETSSELNKVLYNFTKKDQKELMQDRIESKNFSLKFDWEIFIKNYLECYDIALRKNNNNFNKNN